MEILTLITIMALACLSYYLHGQKVQWEDDFNAVNDAFRSLDATCHQHEQQRDRLKAELSASQEKNREDNNRWFDTLAQANREREVQVATLNDQLATSRMEHAGALAGLKQQHQQELQAARKEAAAKSRSVRGGHDLENIAPILQDRYDHKDFRPIGAPVDFLIYDGLEALRGSPKLPDGSSRPLEGIILLDIKTGSSGLSGPQRRIRDAVIAGKVSFATYNATTNEWKEWTQQLPVSPTESQ